MKNNILVVAAHPDDEVLGLAGTLCKHRDAGDSIFILILGNGEDARDQEADVKKRLDQAKTVADKLKAELRMEDLPDNAFDMVSLLSIAKKVEGVVSKIKPNVIYTHNPTDLNVDHRLTFQAVLTACRPQPGHPVKKILAFETPSSTEWQVKDNNQFKPVRYVNIEKELDEKLELISIYKDELRDYPHPRSIEGVRVLAQYRGIEVGLKAAEGFQVIRAIKR